jgi:hypothetical protein
MTTLIPGKTPRKPVAGGRYHTIATSTPSKSSLKTTAVRQAPDNNHGLSSRGGDLFDLAAADLDDPAGDPQYCLNERFKCNPRFFAQELFLKGRRFNLTQVAILKFTFASGQQMTLN